MYFSHHVLDLGDNVQCSDESWEHFPLELHRLLVDSIPFSTLGEFINQSIFPFHARTRCSLILPMHNILSRRIHRLSLLTIELFGRSIESSFSKKLLASRSELFLGFLSVLWPTYLLHRTIVLPFFVADLWLNVNSPNVRFQDELRLAEWQSWTFSISMYSYRGDQFRLLACVWVVVASSSRLSRGVKRQHATSGNCAATSSRPRRWCGNFLRQVSLHVLENSDPGLFLQQRVSLHVRSSLHLLGTLENLTLRHFALNLQRQVSLHFVVWDSNLADWVLWVSPGDLMHSNSALHGERCSNMRDQVQRQLRLWHNSLFSCSLLHSFWHLFGTANWAENADIEQTEKIVPFITSEIALCQYVCELVCGVNIFDLDLGVQIHCVKKPIMRNSVSSGYVSLCWTSTLDDHLDHCFTIFKNVEHRTKLRRLHVWRSIIDVAWFKIVVLNWRLDVVLDVFSLMVCHAAGFPAHSLWISKVGWKKNATLI